MQVPSLGREDPLEKGMATHSMGCLENPMDGGAWWATVHTVVKSRTQPKWLMHAYICVRVRCVCVCVCVYIYVCVCVCVCVCILSREYAEQNHLLCLLNSGRLCKNSKISTGWWRMSRSLPVWQDAGGISGRKNSTVEWHKGTAES